MFGPEVPAVAAADVPDGAFLLDVREDEEWVAGHVPGAVHLPMMQVPSRLAEIPKDGDVVLVCRSGARSAQVTAYLHRNGWDNVRNLDGGMHEWVACGRDLVSEDGHPARVL